MTAKELRSFRSLAINWRGLISEPEFLTELSTQWRQRSNAEVAERDRRELVATFRGERSR